MEDDSKRLVLHSGSRDSRAHRAQSTSSSCGHHLPSLFSDQEKSDIGSAGSIKIEEQTLQSHLVRLFGLSNVDESVVFQKPLEQTLPGVHPRSRRRLPCVKKTVPLYSSHIHVNSPDIPHSASAVG